MKIPRSSALALIASLLVLPAVAAVDFHDHIGLQMWSLRDQTKVDMAAALDLVKSYGITEIETAGTGNLSTADYMKLVNERGLKPVGAHIGYEALDKDLAGSIATAKALGVKYVVSPWIPHGKEGLTAELAHKAAADFNKWGAAFRAEGITYGYHPHGFEFVALPSEGGKTAFEVIASETKAENVAFEMDVFWVFHAGQDPAKLLHQYAGRWLLAPHLMGHGMEPVLALAILVGGGLFAFAVFAHILGAASLSEVRAMMRRQPA